MDNSDNCPNKSHAVVAGALDTSDVLMSEEILSAHWVGSSGGFIQTVPFHSLPEPM